MAALKVWKYWSRAMASRWDSRLPHLQDQWRPNPTSARVRPITFRKARNTASSKYFLHVWRSSRPGILQFSLRHRYESVISSIVTWPWWTTIAERTNCKGMSPARSARRPFRAALLCCGDRQPIARSRLLSLAGRAHERDRGATQRSRRQTKTAGNATFKTQTQRRRLHCGLPPDAELGEPCRVRMRHGLRLLIKDIAVHTRWI